ncbi:MAG: GDYXXLXY domain-containing protein [Kiritimatiellaeota bacterium]|nr:GDYXXLXY domain-containing protein [Kiritimatiellota bacterium]
MHKRNLLLLGFALVVAAQLAVPAWMIVEREWTLRDGQVFKFKTRPIDPSDAFRGRYVWLGLEPNPVKVPDVSPWSYHQKAFAVLAADTNGFAIVERLAREAPAGQAAVPVRVSWTDTKKGEVHINWTGLDRLYMTEKKAPAAEDAYHAHSRRTNSTCHVTVRVRGTRAVIENLFIENQPIHDWLKTHPAGK